MNIYFAGSIRGGREHKQCYAEIIQHLQQYGPVLTEHVGDLSLTELGEDGPSEASIFSRDIDWIERADLLIAEVSTPSLGVGYEIAKAETLQIPILCLFKNNSDQRLSAMIRGNPSINIFEYGSLQEVKEQLNSYLMNIDK